MDNEMIMVSIYCLAYNHEAYISDCLQGFVDQQTTFQYEVFVHDDASTDQTASIIGKYAKKYPQIIKPILQTQNQYSQGVRIVSTYIYPRMKGRYIAICEGDDFWNDVSKLQQQVEFLESHKNYSACVHDSNVIDCRNDRKSHFSSLSQDMDITTEDIALKWPTLFQTSSVMYRKSLYMQRPEFLTNAKSFGDLPLALYLSLNGRIRYIHKPMSTYRRFSAGSWSSRLAVNGTFDQKLHAQKKHLEHTVEMYEMMDKYTKGEQHDIVQKAISKAHFDYEIVVNPKGILRREYCELFSQFPLKRKCKVIFRALFQLIAKR